MPVPSSGGIAVGEILNLIEAYDERTGTPTSEVDDVQYLHRFSEASATAFADRNRYVGDVPGVPTAELLSQAFADERACLFDPTRAHPRRCRSASPTARTPSVGRDGRLRHARPRGRLDDAPVGRRPLGQRGGLHLDDRGDRRLGHHRARLGLPPQQRAHRLQLRAAVQRGARPQPAGPGQAPALVDEPDDGRRRRHARARGRQPRRGVDHHDGRADRPRPLRAGAHGRRRARRAAAVLAQRRERAGRAGHRRPARSAPGSRPSGTCW